MMPHGGLRLDDIDERLLSLLRQDARQPIAQLAKELGVSRGHLYSRIARLEEDGIVAGYTSAWAPSSPPAACARI